MAVSRGSRIFKQQNRPIHVVGGIRHLLPFGIGVASGIIAYRTFNDPNKAIAPLLAAANNLSRSALVRNRKHPAATSLVVPICAISGP